MTRPAGGGSPRGGGGGGMGRRGGMGGGRMGGGPKSITVTTKITVGAHFGRDGKLMSGTIVETSQAAGDQSDPNQEYPQGGQSPPNPQTQPSTRSWQIERTG